MSVDKSGWNLGPPMGHLGVVDDDVISDPDFAENLLFESAFTIGRSSRVGIELEWLVYDAADARQDVLPERISAALNDAILDGSRSSEPGGQLELSSKPASLEDCITRSLSDLTGVRARLAATGLQLFGVGLDPIRRPRFQIHLPRYQAMCGAFDREGAAGRWMLCSTASVQVSIDPGEPENFRLRWDAAQAVAPVFAAVFANSPSLAGEATGWQSTRLAMWLAIDRTRTAPLPTGQDPRTAWTDYALDANVICIRRSGSRPWSAPVGLTFRKWILDRWPHVPTVGDLRYHLSTLFPPVKPRGYLELRMIDAQPDDDWIVPVSVINGLLDDHRAIDECLAATEQLWAAGSGTRQIWTRAARDGLSDPVIYKAALRCFEAAHDALSRTGLTSPIINKVDSFYERFLSRRECPADSWPNHAPGRDNRARIHG